MATIGLDRLYYTKITENDAGEETYGTPSQLAKAISADLSVELAEATALGLLVPEAINDIADLEGQGIAQEPIFDGGAADAGSAFRAQGDGAVALIGKGIHLLIDNIGGIAYPTLEQLGVLEGGGADLAVAVQRRRGKQGALDILPAGGFGGEKIIGATGAGGEDGHRVDLPSLGKVAAMAPVCGLF